MIPLFQLLKRSQKRYSQIFSFFNLYNRENINFCTIIFVHIFVHLIFFILKLRKMQNINVLNLNRSSSDDSTNLVEKTRARSSAKPIFAELSRTPSISYTTATTPRVLQKIANFLFLFIRHHRFRAESIKAITPRAQ